MWMVKTCLALFLLCVGLLFSTGNWTYFWIACAFQVIMIWEAGAVERHKEIIERNEKETWQ